jgi:XTP/dITP diphosphohydrolase
VENALIKARHACRATGLPALADDSGLVVDALDGAPGLLSARYAGVHGDATGQQPQAARRPAGAAGGAAHGAIRRGARAVAPRRRSLPLVAQGVWEGRVLEAPRGALGHGYDPVFFDPVLGRGAAELAPAEKNRVSHRGQALAKLRELLAC